jgi:hypothetical protein
LPHSPFLLSATFEFIHPLSSMLMYPDSVSEYPPL